MKKFIILFAIIVCLFSSCSLFQTNDTFYVNILNVSSYNVKITIENEYIDNIKNDHIKQFYATGIEIPTGEYYVTIQTEIGSINKIIIVKKRLVSHYVLSILIENDKSIKDNKMILIK
jgi:hypothetical protein